MEQLNQALEEVKLDVVASVAKKTVPQLAVEIWVTVFRKLCFEDWCNVRLTSHQWRDIVDGDRLLMDKFILKFPQHYGSRAEDWRAPITLPASTIILKDASITNLDWWSPRITEKLVNLELDDCLLSNNLFRMLRHTPNLVYLRCCGSDLFYEEASNSIPDIQLKRMEKLTLSCVQQDAVIELFSRACPRLKDFAILSDYRKCHRGVLKMIEALPSLEGISLVSSSEDLSHLIGVNHRFKRLSITITNINNLTNVNLISFSQKQPLLESFELVFRKLTSSVRNLVLTAVFQNFSRLKRLSMKFCYDARDIPIDLQSIGCLTELEYLNICGNGYNCCQLSFAGAQNLKLEELCLNRVDIRNSTEIRDYIGNAPSLHTITLFRCIFDSWSACFIVLHANMLRRLKLDRTYFQNRRSCRYLDELCHQVEELHLENMSQVNDAVILALCRKMKKLRKLTISQCHITDVSVQHIIEEGLNLEQVTIIDCKMLTTEGIARLQAAKIATVEMSSIEAKPSWQN